MRQTQKRAAAILASVLALTACGSSSSSSAPAESRYGAGLEEDLTTAGRTGAKGAETGAKTGVEGVKAFGDATVGLVEGGQAEAKTRWQEGKQTTKQTARGGAAETKQEARRCR